MLLSPFFYAIITPSFDRRERKELQQAHANGVVVMPRVVMMLVPRDAHRCMATMETGRVSKVKVLKITNIDETENYTWAQSTVDSDFYYEVGKWLEPANGFQEDRWKDSSPGIHFFLDRQQCVDYQSK